MDYPKEVTTGNTRIILQLPEEILRPSPPTPRWVLVTFSLVCGLAFLDLGLVEAGRKRT